MMKFKTGFLPCENTTRKSTLKVLLVSSLHLLAALILATSVFFPCRVHYPLVVFNLLCVCVNDISTYVRIQRFD